MANFGGVHLECRSCGKEVVLPYTDGTRKAVEIEPIKGWEAPPLMCPECAPNYIDKEHG